MSRRLLGECGICGGPVTAMDTAAGLDRPCCEGCQAEPKHPWGRVLDMRPGGLVVAAERAAEEARAAKLAACNGAKPAPLEQRMRRKA